MARRGAGQEVVMESTAQYWKPVWETLERSWKVICQSREGMSLMSGDYIWRKPCLIGGGAGASRIFETPNAW